MNFPLKKKWLILPLCACLSLLGYSQKQHAVEFSTNGMMTAAPPKVLQTGDVLLVRVHIDSKSFEKKIYEALERYLATMTTINDDELYKYIDEDNTGLDGLRCSLGKQVETISKKYLDAREQAVISQRLGYLDYFETCSEGEKVPNLDSLIIPAYRLQVSYFDAHSNKVGITKTFDLEGTVPSPKQDFSLAATLEPIPEKTAEIRFELREEHLLNREVQSKAGGIEKERQEALENALKEVKQRLNDTFQTRYTQVKERAEEAAKFLKDPRTGSINKNWLDQSNALLNKVDSTAGEALVFLKTKRLKEWFLDWMWLTRGIPKINPFEFQAQPLFAASPAGAAKVTEKEKALADLFDNMVNKQSFRIGSLPDAFSENHLDRIADIKARLKTESVVAATISNDYDILLYSGILKSYSNKYSKDLRGEAELNFLRSSVPITYMISHDAARNFLLMHGMQKEIKENDQLFVGLQNKKPGGVFSVEVTSTALASDPSAITEETNLSAGQFSISALADIAKNKAIVDSLAEKVLKVLEHYNKVHKKVQFLLSLNAAPKLPVLFTKDESPAWETEILNYNQVIHAPSIAEYKIKSDSGDKEKEVYKGQFRVNKRYNLRFKAGALYSFLEKKDYTQAAGNGFTETREESGIDGTFGLQIFPIKTDIRHINITKGRVAPFLYLGLSMKNIKENFYPGVGLEIFSGLSVTYTHHIGKTEVLTGKDGVPLQIESKWDHGRSVSLLVDGSLFVNLFKFGSNKSLLGF